MNLEKHCIMLDDIQNIISCKRKITNMDKQQKNINTIYRYEYINRSPKCTQINQ